MRATAAWISCGIFLSAALPAADPSWYRRLGGWRESLQASLEAIEASGLEDGGRD